MMAQRFVQSGRRIGKTVAAQAVRDANGRVRRQISIHSLLEWAFADECASIDFEDEGTLAMGYGAIGNAYLMAQRGALGDAVPIGFDGLSTQRSDQPGQSGLTQAFGDRRDGLSTRGRQHRELE